MCNYQLLKNNTEYVESLDQTVSPYPEEVIYKFLKKHEPIGEKINTNIIFI